MDRIESSIHFCLKDTRSTIVTGDDVDSCDLPSGYIDYDDFSQPIVAILPAPEVQDLTSFKPLSENTFYYYAVHPK